METQLSERKGLRRLNDDALAQIVQNDIDDYGELKTCEAKIAFAELSKRTPESE